MFIDQTKLPQFDIDLSQLNNACEIKGIMRNLGVLYYVYAFVYKGTVMKYGQSSYVTNYRKDPHGERIYRQARYIPGWSEMPMTANSAGGEFIPVIEQFGDIHKNDVSIHVWDMTSHQFSAEDFPEHDLTIVENQLIEQHKEVVGYIPVGNIKDESHIKSKSIVTDTVFNNLFEAG